MVVEKLADVVAVIRTLHDILNFVARITHIVVHNFVGLLRSVKILSHHSV